jgi:hypothetical protein
MARGKMDEEVLCLTRASKLIEALDDARAQARVASYLNMRFTSAGEGILQSEDRAEHMRAGKPEDPRQPLLPHVAVAPPTSPQVASAASGPTPAPTGAATPPGAAKEAPFFLGGGPGWNASGKGSEHDDDPMPVGKPTAPPHKPKAKASKDGGWDIGKSDEDPDAEVEVKI